MYVFCLECMHVTHKCVWCPWRSEDQIPWNWGYGWLQTAMRAQWTKAGPPGEQQVLFTTESSSSL